MTIDSVIRRIGEVGIIPVVRASNADEASRAVEAICRGGIPIIEITMTVPDAPAVIRDVVRRHGSEVLVGAGTVLSADQAKMCVDAGAEFLVSPGLSLAVLLAARACDKLAIAGALTPTELMNAQASGSVLVKIFPCGNMGGPNYLRSLKAPFPDAALIPTGGVKLSNAGEFILAGAFALGVGADLVDVASLRAGNQANITRAASDLVQVVQEARTRMRSAKEGEHPASNG
jgi:2-dehydro-3-deoxyphosphogluconate aldolase/(4S)-4-hydroxy-2-oxoglutarate aldolase